MMVIIVICRLSIDPISSFMYQCWCEVLLFGGWGEPTKTRVVLVTSVTLLKVVILKHISIRIHMNY